MRALRAPSAPIVESYEIDPAARRDEWLSLRASDVTASVSAALLGIHPYKSRFALWQEKAGRVAEDAEETAAMIRGRVLEAPALDLLAIDKPTWRIERPNVYLRDAAARMGATPDAYAIDPKRPGFGVVQVKSVEKSVFRKNWFDETGEVEAPLYIAVQTIQEAHLAGAAWACVAAMVVGFGLEMHAIEVPIHAGLIARLRTEIASFWKSIAEDNPPTPDYGRDGSLLAGIYASDNGREIDLSGDNHLPVILAERAEAKARVKADEARIAEIETEIIAKLGDHERGFIPGWSIKRPLIQRPGFYVDPTEYRRLNIKQLA
jgi:predicted phage-related endonuclease